MNNFGYIIIKCRVHDIILYKPDNILETVLMFVISFQQFDSM